MSIYKTLTVFLMALTGFQVTAMQQPTLRQQLINAVYEGNNERVEQLMLAGAPVDSQALFYPTLNGNYDVVKTIFECGVDPESPVDTNQWYAGYPLFMHLALNQNLQLLVKEKLIKLYLKHGADIELRYPTGSSLLIDVNHLDFNTLKLLLELGADANAQNWTGITPLMTLVTSPVLLPPATPESEKMSELELKKKAELLIQYGADVNLKDYLGSTGLMYAVSNGRKIFVELLLENGAIVYLKNKSGLSALDYAKDQPEIMKLLVGVQATPIEKFIRQAIGYISQGTLTS